MAQSHHMKLGLDRQKEHFLEELWSMKLSVLLAFSHTPTIASKWLESMKMELDLFRVLWLSWLMRQVCSCTTSNFVNAIITIVWRFSANYYDFFFKVPGPVSGLSGTPTQNSVELTWTTPEEPNGIVINYEVTYRINNSNIIAVNTTGLRTAFTIPSLTPGTRVSNISVSAYTIVGRGEPATLDDTTTLNEICKELN